MNFLFGLAVNLSGAIVFLAIALFFLRNILPASALVGLSTMVLLFALAFTLITYGPSHSITPMPSAGGYSPRASEIEAQPPILSTPGSRAGRFDEKLLEMPTQPEEEQ